MNHHYADIRDKLGEPQWWDEYAVPRYCDFGPRESANIYADHAVLLLIECQDCGTEFKVCMSGRKGYPAGDGYEGRKGLDDAVREDEIHYGDPPNSGCCAAGPTMNSVPRRVLEFWQRAENGWDWERVPDLEREIACDWADSAASSRTEPS